MGDPCLYQVLRWEMTDMGRLFSVFLLLAVLLCPAVRKQDQPAQPVFFSMIFPQLIPERLVDGQAVWEVFL